MATSNYKTHLQGEEVVLKKYFYSLRPILACFWIINEKTNPPVKFEDLLYSQMDKELIKEVEELVKTKKELLQRQPIKRNDILNNYIIDSMAYIKNEADNLKKQAVSSEELNQLFLEGLDFYDED